MVRILEKEINAIEKAIRELVQATDGMRTRAGLIESIQGVGKITAWTFLTFLSEIEQLNRNKAVALAGLAPFNRDRGKFIGKRAMMGGRAKVRECLYMAAHSAASCKLLRTRIHFTFSGYYTLLRIPVVGPLLLQDPNKHPDTRR